LFWHELTRIPHQGLGIANNGLDVAYQGLDAAQRELDGAYKGRCDTQNVLGIPTTSILGLKI